MPRLACTIAVLAAVASLTGCGSAGHTTTTGMTTGTPQGRDFYTPGPKGVACEVGRIGGSYVFCLAFRHPPYRTAIAARMNASGHVALCHGLRCISNTAGATVAVGRSIEFGPFRCTSLQAGVRCIVTKLGHGFLLSVGRFKRI